MLKFNQYITEALPLSIAKQYTQAFDRTRYDSIFKGQYRIYIPLGKVEEETKAEPNPIIANYLKDKGYKIDDYLNGLASTENSKNIYKIGKLLNDNPELKKQFDNDPKRASVKSKKQEMMVVISRHPYDIAGMSSNRGWTSCMNLGVVNPRTGKDEQGRGSYSHFVMNDVKEGTLVAYLIKNDDKNIQEPLARLLIKPFVNAIKNKKDIMLVPETKIYPYEYEKSTFYPTVEKWCDKQNEKLTDGYYKIKDNLYCDSDVDYKLKIKGTPEALSAEDLMTLIAGKRLTKEMKETKDIVAKEYKVILNDYVKDGKLSVDLSEWSIKVDVLRIDNLTTLKGLPNSVDGALMIQNSNFEDLTGCPHTTKSLEFLSTKIKSLKGIQRTLYKDFNCSDTGLTTLKDGPREVWGVFYCSKNNLTSLEGCPEKITTLDCSHNKITSLKGCPKKMDGFICSNNELTSLEGGPEFVWHHFNCSNNKLTNLIGSPETLGKFICSNNKLTDFEGCPEGIGISLIALGNPITSIKGIADEIGWDVRVDKDVPDNVKEDLIKKFGENTVKLGNP